MTKAEQKVKFDNFLNVAERLELNYPKARKLTKSKCIDLYIKPDIITDKYFKSFPNSEFWLDESNNLVFEFEPITHKLLDCWELNIFRALSYESFI